MARTMVADATIVVAIAGALHLLWLCYHGCVVLAYASLILCRRCMYACSHRVESSMMCAVLYRYVALPRRIAPQWVAAGRPVGIGWDRSHLRKATGCNRLAEVRSSLYRNRLKMQPVAVPVAPKKGKRPDSIGLSNTTSERSVN
jgi:hypothetical protein